MRSGSCGKRDADATTCLSDIGAIDVDNPEVLLEARFSGQIGLEPGEIVILVVRPHPLLLAANMLPTIVGLLVVLLVLFGMRMTTGRGVTSVVMLILGFALVGSTTLSVLEYRARLYVLTDRRVIRRSGWSRVRRESCLLSEIKSVEVIPEPPEGVSMRVGNILIRSSAGVLPWQYAPNPSDVREVLQDTISRYGGQCDKDGD
jgi:hypothetical protein